MIKLPPEGASLADWQDYVRRMCLERGFADHSVEQKLVKLLEELGELAQAAGTRAGLSTAGRKRPGVAEEAADVTIVFLGLCDKLGIDLEAALRAKELKNNQRTWR